MSRSFAHRYVDMWAFMGLHPTNIDLLQKLKKAEDQRFGANMDVCGTISEKNMKNGEWKQSHMVGIRTDIWNPDAAQQSSILNRLQSDRQAQLRKEIKRSGRLSQSQTKNLERQLERDPVNKMRPQDIENRRLVMKIFKTTGEQIRWTGSVEEMVTRELHNSLGVKRTILSFATNLQGYDYMTYMQENNRTFRIPSIFSFSYFDERLQKMWYLKIKRKWISIGADFVIEACNQQIGEIDGALIGLGYNAHVYMYEQTLAKDQKFLDLITLFTTTVGYHSAMRRSLKRRLKATQRGHCMQNIIEDEEFRLLRNPRSAA
ncbi:hypothetical protein [Thalassoglobus sp.]|uniref:hypothetical protein n=1 Tax=Thalassoglobus sp. TaxID=2795869 RepID=UPI003AA98BAB